MNRFEPIEFEGLNESDVREEIIALLPRELGYRSGTPNNVIREQSLRYPRKYIGRKKPDRDPILRGSADSILEAQRRVRWTIEAKAPQVVIDEEAIDQSYTYASHPEIRAIYFVICNGKTFQVFQPDLSPTEPPILTVEYAEMNEKFPSIKNLLGPEALLKDHPRQKIDVGIPLGPGLRSVARITNGLICYDNTLNLPALNELQTTIVEGQLRGTKTVRWLHFWKLYPQLNHCKN